MIFSLFSRIPCLKKTELNIDFSYATWKCGQAQHRFFFLEYVQISFFLFSVYHDFMLSDFSAFGIHRQFVPWMLRFVRKQPFIRPVDKVGKNKHLSRKPYKPCATLFLSHTVKIKSSIGLLLICCFPNTNTKTWGHLSPCLLLKKLPYVLFY